MIREWIWMVIFTARQNLANLNEVKMNLIVKFANLAGKSYIITRHLNSPITTSPFLENIFSNIIIPFSSSVYLFFFPWSDWELEKLQFVSLMMQSKADITVWCVTQWPFRVHAFNLKGANYTYTCMKNRVNNSLHLWSEEISFVEEWISLDSNFSRMKLHYSTSEISSGWLDIHSKRSDQWRHYPGSDVSDK